MTGKIAVTPEKLREISGQMKAGAADVEALLARLTTDVVPVRSEWAGPAQAYFNALWDQSRQDADRLRTVLAGVAKLTETAATAYETTEKSIAASFGEFRARPGSASTGVGTVAAPAEAVASAATGSATTDSVVTEPVDQVHDDTASAVVAIVDTPAEEQVPSAVATSEIVVHAIAGLDTATIGDDPVDDAEPSEGSSKVNGRLPWARFMTKSGHRADGADAVIRPRVPERRFKATDPNLKPGTRLCRLCFTVVALQPEMIERTETINFVRCPYCENSFPVRLDDVAALSKDKTATSS